MNPINTNTSGYQAAKANAAALGAKLVSYFETEDMAATTITSDSKKPQTLQELQSYITEKYASIVRIKQLKESLQLSMFPLLSCKKH